MEQEFYVVRDRGYYWSNCGGWTNWILDATKFSRFEREHMDLPMGDAPEWVRVTNRTADQ
jgi:hypothetical protein